MTVLSLEANTLVRLVKKAANDAVAAGNPFALKIGVVVETSPLQISINQKITLQPSQLMLTTAVRDHTISVLVDDESKEVEVHQGLRRGESVILLRAEGGQKYIVLDRSAAP